jgi:hypothetical protein
MLELFKQGSYWILHVMLMRWPVGQLSLSSRHDKFRGATTSFVAKAALNMNILQRYLSVSSIHGLRYLVKGNSLIIRLTWGMLVMLAFAMCCAMIWNNWADEANHPVATSIESRPASAFAAPALTVAYTNPFKAINPYDVVERVLNYFVYDCSRLEEGDQNVCMEKSIKVKRKFQPLLQTRLRRIRYDFQDMVIRYEEADSLYRNVLCRQIDEVSEVGQIVRKIVMENGTGNDGLDKLKELFEANFLLANREIHQDNKDQDVFVPEEVSKKYADKLCPEWIVKSNSKLLSQVLFYALALTTKIVIPLGSLVTSGDRFMLDLDRNMRNFTSTSNKVLYDYLDMPQGQMVEKALGLTIGNVKNVSLEDAFLVNAVKRTQLSHNASFYFELAKRLAQDIGLDNDTLTFNHESEFPLYTIWYCEIDGKRSEVCPNAKMVPGDSDVNYVLNLGDWKDVYKMSEPRFNAHVYAKNSDLTMENDLTMHLYIGNLKS